MVTETILQSEIMTRFVLPFLLVFFILYGILEKTKAFGETSKQLHAFVAFVIGLILVGAVSPTLAVNNLILFFTVSVVVLFVALMLWGFVSGEEAKLPNSKPWKIVAGIAIILAVVIAVIYTFNVQGIFGEIFDFLFRQSWSGTLWTNVAFLVVIILALGAVLKKEGD